MCGRSGELFFTRGGELDRRGFAEGPPVEEWQWCPAPLNRVVSALQSALPLPLFGERSQEGVFMFSENILLPRGKGLVGRKVSCFGMFFDLETGLGLLEGQSPGDPT